MICQCKGKDIQKIAPSKLLSDNWIPSTKYDGNYVQIKKRSKEVRFFTSGNKEFFMAEVAEDLIYLNPHNNFTIETEFIANTDGSLGSRVKCSTGTYRANFNKGIISHVTPESVQFKAFKILEWNGVDVSDTPIIYRINLLSTLNLGKFISMATFYHKCNLEEAKKLAKKAAIRGMEGIYCYHLTHKDIEGKDVNTAIKIKAKPTVDLLCIGYTPGEDSYEGMIGSLRFKDKAGRVVNVNGGLEMPDRQKDPSFYIGKVMEIQYEQVLATYINPVFFKPNGELTFRDDKTAEDIS